MLISFAKALIYLNSSLTYVPKNSLLATGVSHRFILSEKKDLSGGGLKSTNEKTDKAMKIDRRQPFTAKPSLQQQFSKEIHQTIEPHVATYQKSNSTVITSQ